MSSPPRNSPLLAREKVMIHLRGFQKFYDDADSPFGATQDGISKGVGVGRNNVSKILKDLIDSGKAEFRTKHVRGLPRKRKVYNLTLVGYSEAEELRRRLEGTEVEVIDFEGRRTRTEIRNVNRYLPKKVDLLAIAMEVKSGIFDARSFYDTNVRSERSYVDHTDKRPAIRRFFGRGEEMACIKAHISDSNASAIVVQGPPGAGKTTLLAKLTRDDMKGVNTLWFQILEWTSAKMLYSSLSEFLSKLGHKGLEMYLSSVDEPEMRDAIPILERSLMDVEGVIVLDDLQKAPKDLNDLMRALFDVTRGSQGIKLLCTSRSTGEFFNRRDILDGSVVEVHLGGLDPESSRLLLEDRGIRGGFESIIDVTEGHPLFLELIDPDRLVIGGDLRLYIEQELLSDMNEAERLVIEIASVLRYPVVEEAFFAIEEGMMAISGKNVEELSYDDYTVDYDVIAALLKRSVMRESVGRVIGTHDLVREFIYSRIPPRKRRLYHRASSMYYMEGQSPASYMEAIYHSMMAQDLRAASSVAILHGSELIHQGFSEELLPTIDAILDGGSAEDPMDLRILLARVLHRTGDWDRSIETYRGLIDEVDEGLNPHMAFELRRELGSILIRKHDTESAKSPLMDALRILGCLNDDEGGMELYYDLGGLAIIEGDLDRGEAMFKESLRLSRSIDDKEGIGKAYYGLSRIRVRGGRFEDSLECSRRGEMELRMTSAMDLLIQIKQAIATSLRHLTRFDEAIQEQMGAMELADEYGDPFLRMSVIMNLGVMKVEMGDHLGARDHLMESKIFFERIGDTFTASFIDMTMGVSSIISGDVEVGIDLVEEGMSHLERSGDGYSLISWSMEVSKALHEAGRDDLARMYLDRAAPFMNDLEETMLSEGIMSLREMIERGG